MRRSLYRYDAFGGMQESQEKMSNRIKYTGQQHDGATCQYYLRARYYNPVLGRFLQEDVYRGDGLNLYAYVKNNPVIYYDPSGYSSNTLLPNELASETYSNLLLFFPKSGIAPHHMVSNLYMTENYGVHPNDGLAMMLESSYNNKGSRHGKTVSYGRPSANYKASYLSMTPRDALAYDLRDLKKVLKNQGLYDKHARTEIKNFINKQKTTAYTSDPQRVSKSSFNGTNIINEQIFSKNHPENKKKVVQACKGGI